MEIRILTAEDATQWWRLRLEALEGDPEAFSASLDDHRKLSLDEVKKRLGVGAQDAFVIGAFENGSLLGMAGFYREQNPKVRHKGRVWGVYVTPKSRGTGLGHRLLKTALDRARTIEGVEQVHLSVDATQAAAGRLYHSLGFESFGCEPRALKVGGRYIDEEYMVLRLNQ
jgi:ribosomal protein S18 acetylase RimI-like enzyme